MFVTQQCRSRTIQKAPLQSKYIATLKNTDNFHYERKTSHATTKLTLSTVSKGECNTVEDTGKSMKTALYVLWYVCQKALFGLTQCQTVKTS